MNIKILDSWLREYLKTSSKPEKIAEILSLTSVSVERLEKYMSSSRNDYIYNIEVTTNRPDLMSVIGLARETAVSLPKFGIKAIFNPLKTKKPQDKITKNLPINIQNDASLVNRICAVVMEVEIKESPKYIKDRLETSGIRSINNLIDVTNYVMREVGHPAHVFDYDRLTTHTLKIRPSYKGEKIVALDKKEHILNGGDIVADNGKGEIVDLLGVMGTDNSAVANDTKRILFFIDNNEPAHIRETSMSLAIRTEAATLNEKGVDPELAIAALLRGIQLYQEIANGKIVSDIIDIYPNKVITSPIIINQTKIDKIIGVGIPVKQSVEMLQGLGFKVSVQNEKLKVEPPTWRAKDIIIEEDIIEEIARIYGYHLLPSVLPPLTSVEVYRMDKSGFYWEKRVKDALKYFGFTEVYTYSLVSEDLFEGPTEEAVTLANPLTEDMVYLRRTLVPSLLQAARENKNREDLKIFEIANVYEKMPDTLPKETLGIAGVFKKTNASFFEVKGIIEQLFNDLGIKDYSFSRRENEEAGAAAYIKKEYVGEIEILEENLIDFELNLKKMLNYVSLKKVYKPIPKFPPIIEDIRIGVNPKVTYKEITSLIKSTSKLVAAVSLLDVYEDKKTFRITYQHPEKNLTTEEVAKIRAKIFKALEKELDVEIS